MESISNNEDVPTSKNIDVIPEPEDNMTNIELPEVKIILNEVEDEVLFNKELIYVKAKSN